MGGKIIPTEGQTVIPVNTGRENEGKRTITSTRIQDQRKTASELARPEDSNDIQSIIARSLLDNNYEEIFRIPYKNRVKLIEELKKQIKCKELRAIIIYEYELIKQKFKKAAEVLILNCGVFTLDRQPKKNNKPQKPIIRFLEEELFGKNFSQTNKETTDSSTDLRRNLNVENYVNENAQNLIKKSGLYSLLLLVYRFNLEAAKDTLITKLNDFLKNQLNDEDPVYQDIHLITSSSYKGIDKIICAERINCLCQGKTDDDIKRLINACLENGAP